jgi:hypothetical protein
MAAVEKIQRHIDSGNLQIMSIVSVARSRSTAIGRAFGQSSNGSPRFFVNEPFHWKAASMEEGYGCLLNAIEPALNKADHTLMVVTKNMATYMNADAYRLMAAMAIGTIFTVRNPYIQIGSLLERGINDSQLGFGANVIQQTEVPDYFSRLSEVYKSKSSEFRMGWRAIFNHYMDATSGLQNMLVIDGDAAACNPASVLQSACQRLDMPYHSGMVQGWSQEGYANIGGAGNSKDPENNAWAHHALTSSGLGASAIRSPLDLSTAPVELRNYVANVAVPIYRRMSEDMVH